MYYSFFLVFAALAGFIIWLCLKEEESMENKTKKIIGIVSVIIFLLGAMATIIINVMWEKHHIMQLTYVYYNPYLRAVEPARQIKLLPEDEWTLKEMEAFDKYTLKPCKLYTLTNHSTRKDAVYRARNKTKIIEYLQAYYADDWHYKQRYKAAQEKIENPYISAVGD